MQKYIDAAKITGRKNLDGRLVARAGAGLPFLLEEGMGVWLVPPVLDAPRHVTVEAVSPVGADEAVVSFEEIDDASSAELVVGCHCLVDEGDVSHIEGYGTVVAPSGAYDGWALYDERSGARGTIERAESVGGQVLLVVRLDGECDKEHLVPLADDLLLEVDPGEKILVMDCPSGIFEL